MSAVAYVGSAVELIFTTVPGADVTMTWLDPNQAPVLDGVEVAEDPDGSGKYPYTFSLTSAGMWTAQFTASGTTTVFDQYFMRAIVPTGPPPFAAVGDVRAQMGSMTAAQESLAAWLIRAASNLVRSRVPLIDQQIALGLVTAEMAALTVTNMVLRVLRNPNGLRSETVGPFSRAYDTSVAAGLLVFSEDDAAIITPVEQIPDGLGGLGIGTIRIVPGMAPPVYRRRWGGPHAGL
jgi:hypothetical protein